MKIRAGLLVGYDGSGYHGLQFNKELDTIEKKVVDCLLSVGAISERNAEDPKKIHIKSSSRTDKGVHAAFNLISVKIEVCITPELVSRLRTLLSQEGIHLYDIVKLTKSTVPSKQAISRTYEYVVPTFFLTEGNFSEEAEALKQKDGEHRAGGIKRDYPEDVVESVTGYRSSPDDIKAFESILQKYIGTKDFHNFTKLNNEKGTKRYIKSITITDPYVSEDVEYVRISITGQSFLLHQIRKMVLFAVLLCKYSRNSVDQKFSIAFNKQNVHVPKGPSEYLLLDKPVFHKLRRGDGSTEDIDVSDSDREEYKRSFIYPRIHQRKNLIGFFACLDSVRFHKENIAFID
ncbi:pseudouridine synthase [Encephalitozoon hellem ATCC 50504]|uniref:tRNA pseudouridine synthase n=1 Tax=Encephalitozoon hellem TaxID=27973 RepID=A0A9Q9C3R4_ENCHE|nr:pseudouridine synthase [Encephalitozoon hellem ATCC 50504]AFM98131.1 pseudouridine synthase [Encephalitozoon hellem ATCC 50504]UTX42975.1 tRNA pseudouridine synthase [Encephalitozoon hellem]WEL38432.1 tRNA pseudouridine synthase [Encephalitozoon hellem]|eukprot:XP_003887112.1 pseudouridine synthase [Encephalitozoon hellem ATCC 50504]